MNPVKSSSASLDRAQAQRQRILAAARCCFVKSGFHAASMATIAETANMSAGLIYRYFENKNAIILAIIEEQLQISRERIRELKSTSDLSTRIIEYFDEHEACDDDTMSPVLYLEMSAEATRDPQIAAALKAYDLAVCSELSNWLARSKEQGGLGLPADIASARTQMLLGLIEGLKIRGMREPGLDWKVLGRTLDDVIDTLLSVPGGD